ncbi:hypothetical protein STRCI_005098 [Streptomyces cinnabarinus]|uniref:PH domain-containing protein n=1 Tax=Streptomyces cinnabarinus TaxID=67287 RepID=A0ABY7KJH8_9ACTN|nr:hypothetical protein [Streptomyces cinnabarinus]WAZ23735.1 hypothetical protein STRCI_005098 [Streptomyces cinnabarinus]
MPVRGYGRFDELVTLGAVAVTFPLGSAGVEPYLAALLPLQLLWVLVRPEVVRVAAPGLVVAVAVDSVGWPGLLGAGVFGGVCLGLAELRLWVRRRQRECALAASEGVTAPVPGAESPLRRGVLLGVAGLASVIGGGLLAGADGATAAVGYLLAGLGLTLLVSGALGRYRAHRLHSAPAPVLRVLIRDDAAARTEVFAADDVDALRPLFVVSVMPVQSDEEEPDQDDSDQDDSDEGDSDEGVDDLLERLDDDAPGPLREAVLYGVPYDGAEVVIVSADEDLDEEPVVERSSGPVRPVRKWAVRGADGTAGDVTIPAQPVLRWRAGWLDLVAALLLAQWGVWLAWGAFTDAGTALWEQILVGVLGVFGAARVPVKLAWRITADRTGLWINGLFRITHIPWDDFRSARHQSLELKLRRRGGPSWAVAAPGWKWLERRRGLTHPYDRLAAELTALGADPALRPTGDSVARERGRVVWPWALVLAAGWVAALVVLRAGL